MEEVCATETKTMPAAAPDTPAPDRKRAPDGERQQLSAMGIAYLRHVLSDDQLALYRVVTRDAHRFPELGRLYRAQVTDGRTRVVAGHLAALAQSFGRSEEHTSELQSLMRISYAVSCLKHKN